MKKFFLLVLKMTLFYSLVGLLIQSLIVSTLLAFPVKGQDVNDIKDIRIDVNFQNVPIEEAFRIIEKNYNVKFLYINSEIPLNEKITFNAKLESLNNILEYLAKEYKLNFHIINNEIVVKRIPIQDNNQKKSSKPGSIEGKISDASSGEALIGANIIIEGTSLGAATDLEGNYSVSNIPEGSYNIKVSYIGYNTLIFKIQIKSEERITKNIKLEAVGVTGKEIVVTAQASGQNEAINQQLASNHIVNVVSSARIQELPDANAAESVGRLPGVFLVRSNGEGSQVAIRGLEPKYNRVMIDGVEIPSTDADNRSSDLSMISSSMLSGIELYKTVTPDMNAAVLGGTVNFQIREAQETANKMPNVHLSLQGGYNNLQNNYNDYKITADGGERFFNDRFGVLAVGVIERKNLTADIFGGTYGVQNSTNPFNPGTVVLNSINLLYNPTEKQRYNGTLVFDYRWNSGKVDLMNFLSRGAQATQTFNQNYNLNGGGITFQASEYEPVTNVVTNILDLKQEIMSFKIDGRVSHAYTENINPGYWQLTFTQAAKGLSGINNKEDPVLIAQKASTYAILDSAFLSGINTNSSFTRQRNISGSLDFERDFSFSNFISASLKFGGNYRYTYRSYDYSTGGGTNLDNLAETATEMRAYVISQNQWMAQPPYNLKTNGYDRFPLTMFLDKTNSFHKFLGGNYLMLGYPMSTTILNQIQREIIISQLGDAASPGNYYAPDMKGNIADDYFGNEYENGFYVMSTINLGPIITIIPGVRYQGLETKYTAAYIPLWGSANTYPNPFEHTDTTVTRYHGYWLPDVTLRYKMFTWLDLKLSYTNTLSYPDFLYVTPQIHINSSVQPGDVERWNNVNLKPARSQNYDIAISVYNNDIGLFTINPFFKRIDDFIFTYGGYGITDPSIYPLPPSTVNYTLSNTQVNDPNRVDVSGIELDWQTHFWYLPSIFSGLVLNINYTYNFSQAKYPYHLTYSRGFPPVKVQIDTFYTARLIDQASNIVNLSVGYDYKGLSARINMIYESDVFHQTDFQASLRQNTSSYIRWDFNAKQTLPWYNLEVFLDILNLNGEPDIQLIEGSGYPTSEQSYGLTADFGLRWHL